MLRAFHLHHSYASGQVALHDVNFHIEHGDFALITGPSGAGKSTLLKLIYGAMRPSSGQLLVAGIHVGSLKPSGILALRRRMGIVFQDFRLLEECSVQENIALPLESIGFAPHAIARKCLHIAHGVGLAQHLHMPVAALSGGEQQRVAIARALVHDPILLLADEPTGSVDEIMGEQLMALLRHANVRGTTVIMTTHNPRLIAQHTGPVLRLDVGTHHPTRCAA